MPKICRLNLIKLDLRASQLREYMKLHELFRNEKKLDTHQPCLLFIKQFLKL